ncbi:MAG: hypothetical protein ACREBE_09770, partial [bacterium]
PQMQPPLQAPVPAQPQPGSIADVIASSIDGASDAPSVQPAGALISAAVLQGAVPQAAVPLETTAPTEGATPPTEGATAPRAPAKVSDSPVSAWVAAAVARAVGSFAGTTNSTGASTNTAAGGHPAHGATAASTANSVDAANPASTAGAPNGPVPSAAVAEAALDGALPALSPLEQAVHDLIGRATERDDKNTRALAADAAAPGTAAVSLQMFSAPATTEAAPRGNAPPAVHAAQAAQLPEPPTNPSHVHLVLDDGPERTVVTVAVRGSEVHVALRSSDEATGAALARNAASLDHAMRARGLQLGDLTADREPRDPRQPRDPEPRERRDPHTERFELEEKP